MTMMRLNLVAVDHVVTAVMHLVFVMAVAVVAAEATAVVAVVVDTCSRFAMFLAFHE